MVLVMMNEEDERIKTKIRKGWREILPERSSNGDLKKGDLAFK